MLDSHAYCTSVKCAAVVWVFGGKFRVQPSGDPITVEIDGSGKEDAKYHFFGTPDVGFQIADIISAYSILARGVPSGFSPKREVLAMIENKDHPIHCCFKALTERDRLHRLYLEAVSGKVKPSGDSGAFSTNLTMLAACLVASGHKEIGYRLDGQKALFEFDSSPEVLQLVEAYQGAWEIMLLPNGHPLYWMKSVLDRRNEILIEKRKCEPFYVEQKGNRIIKTPLHITDENLEKSKKYINS
jgi:hypothetical protein